VRFKRKWGRLTTRGPGADDATQLSLDGAVAGFALVAGFFLAVVLAMVMVGLVD